jgi:type I restriction enzyme M protein
MIGEVFSSVECTRIESECNLLDILDKVHRLRLEEVDETHIFTPREVIKAMVKVIDPEIGETIYDPCCGTSGFLAQAYKHPKEKIGTADDIEILLGGIYRSLLWCTGPL